MPQNQTTKKKHKQPCPEFEHFLPNQFYPMINITQSLPLYIFIEVHFNISGFIVQKNLWAHVSPV